ncbi:MAG TPA: cytochrome c biogenesis protein CcdA [Ktedonobacterales bacterium]|nr:cytochrome c biogenesis protein CcdA [Ktedonobacterales bacterium]
MAAIAPFGWSIGIAAFVAGMLSFFSPCVAPLVPGYIGYLSGASAQAAPGAPAADGAANRRLARICLLFVAGFSVAFVALGLVAASFGALLAAYRLALETVAGIVMIVLGAFLLNLLPRAWMWALVREWRLPLPPRALARMGSLAPFGLGVVFAAGWTPCIGPVLGAILLYAGSTSSAGAGAALLAAYALGFALPFLAVGLGWATGLRALGWLKRYGQIVTIVSGVALILVGLVYLTGQVSQFAIWAQRVAAP